MAEKITATLAKSLRFNCGLQLPVDAKYTHWRVAEIAVLQASLFVEIEKLDTELVELADREQFANDLSGVTNVPDNTVSS